MLPSNLTWRVPRLELTRVFVVVLRKEVKMEMGELVKMDMEELSKGRFLCRKCARLELRKPRRVLGVYVDREEFVPPGSSKRRQQARRRGW